MHVCVCQLLSLPGWLCGHLVIPGFLSLGMAGCSKSSLLVLRRRCLTANTPGPRQYVGYRSVTLCAVETLPNLSVPVSLSPEPLRFCFFWGESPVFCRCTGGTASLPCGLGKITRVGQIVILPLSSVVSPPHSPVLRSTWWPRFLNCPSPLNQDRPCSPLAATPAPRAGQRMQRPSSAKLITTHPSILHLPKSCHYPSSTLISGPMSFVFICWSFTFILLDFV